MYNINNNKTVIIFNYILYIYNTIHIIPLILHVLNIQLKFYTMIVKYLI